MERCVDCVYRIFLVENSASFLTPGHEEIEIALLRLYRVTGNDKYLELGKFFLDQRGNNGKDGEVWRRTRRCYEQSHVPIRQMDSAEGHSVRAMYLYTAMADLAGETGNEELKEACLRLFRDITQRKMYITGGVGSTYLGEAFTVAYDLPSEHAYTETCAAIGLMLFSQKMLELLGDSVYADTVERVMYNGMLSGLSLDGEAFFYENPLEVNIRNHHKNSSTEDVEPLPITQRKKIFDCSCCPPNINRILASMERFVCRAEGDNCYVDQYVSSVTGADGARIRISTRYPAKGEIHIQAEGVKRLALRIPGWCREFTISAPYTMEKGYAVIEEPAEVTLILTMTPTLYEACAEVTDSAGKAALMLGPVVYCAEAIDNGNVNLHRLAFDRKLNAQLSYAPEYGMNIISVDGWRREVSDDLYRPLEDAVVPARIRLIPYYGFANRTETDMLVWMRYR